MKDNNIIEEPKAIVVNENNEVFGEYSYFQLINLRLRIIRKEIPIKLYYRNNYGGIDAIDDFACCHNYDPFPMINETLGSIIQAQCDIRKK